MTQPTPRTETLTDQAANTADGIVAETDKFATAGDLTVTVTNNHDQPAEVYLEEAKYPRTNDSGGSINSSPSPNPSWQQRPPRVDLAANGGSTTFDRDVLGGTGDKTFYRVVAEFDTAPSGSGDVSAEFEQLDERRGVDVDSL